MRTRNKNSPTVSTGVIKFAQCKSLQLLSARNVKTACALKKRRMSTCLLHIFQMFNMRVLKHGQGRVVNKLSNQKTPKKKTVSGVQVEMQKRK